MRAPKVVLAVALWTMLLSGASRGAEPGVVPDLTWYTSTADQDTTAAALQDVGAGWVRLNVNWRDAEPVKGSYNAWWFAQYDRSLQLARQAGARVLVMVSQSPAWASGSTNPYARPRDSAEFAGFLKHLAGRYAGRGVEAYEVWNEPNISRFWPTGPDPVAYTAMLKAAYPAIKSGDPAAKVVFGGLSTNDANFVRGAYAAGAKGSFDAMGVHPYTCAQDPALISRDSSGRIRRDSFLGYREVRAAMVEQADVKPIWVTEFGWSSTNQQCGVSEATQAKYLTSAFELLEQDAYMQVALWYTFRNNYSLADRDSLEARYGLLTTAFQQKPAYRAFKAYATGAPPSPPRPAPRAAPAATTTRTKLLLQALRGMRKQGRGSLAGTSVVARVHVTGATRGTLVLRIQRRSGSSRRIIRRARLNEHGVARFRLVGVRYGGRWQARAYFLGNEVTQPSRSRIVRFRRVVPRGARG